MTISERKRASPPAPEATILVVEDVDQVRATMVRCLGRHGYGVLEARDGNAAINALQASLPDVIVTDLIMPDGRPATLEGFPLMGGFYPIPEDAKDVKVSRDGEVICEADGSICESRVLLARFADPNGLRPIGHNLFKATERSGGPELVSATEGGNGSAIVQYYLEFANVSVAEELVELMRVKAAYDLIQDHFARSSPLRADADSNLLAREPINHLIQEAERPSN